MSKKIKTTKESLAAKADQELVTELNNLKKELFNLRFQSVLGELKNTARSNQVRKDIARIKTEISARRLKQNKGQ